MRRSGTAAHEQSEAALVLDRPPPALTGPFDRYGAALSVKQPEEGVMAVDNDCVEGSATNLGGKVKEGEGKLTGDEKLRSEGVADQVKGKVQNAVGGVKDALKGK
jgi:uncharacterized protein YjbJ (UPF0337 family)